MNKFLLICILFVSLSIHSIAGDKNDPNRQSFINYNLCFTDLSGESIEKSLSVEYSTITMMPPFVCPGNAIVDGANAGSHNNAGYSDVFFTLTLTAGQSATLNLTGTNAEMEEIATCSPQPPYGAGVTMLDYCGPTTVIIRVHNTTSDPAGTFALDADINTLQIAAPITIAETGGTVNNDGTLCVGDDLTLTAVLTDPSITGETYDWTLPDGSTSNGNPLNIVGVSVISHNGAYTVTVTDLNGCTDAETVNIIVNALPEFTIDVAENSGLTPDDGTVCVGDDFTLTAVFTVGAGSTYNWSLPGGGTSTAYPLVITNATLANDGDYNLTVTDANGCFNVTTPLTITMEALPTADDTELKACAIAPGSNMGDFVLTDAEDAANYPTNQNDGTDVDAGAAMTVSYHLSATDAMGNLNPQSDGVKADGTILHARVYDPATGCYDISEVTLTVVDLPDAIDTELRACEDPNSPGMADFVLTDAELAPAYPGGNMNVTADIDGGAGGMTVTYHASLADAQNNAGEIFDGPYATSTIYARIEDPTTGCYDVAQVTLTVVLLPAGTPTELKECEMPAGSMMATFTFTDAELAPGFPATNSNAVADVDNGAVRTVTYHGSQADAEDGIGDIGTNGAFTDGTIIWARVEDPATGCGRAIEILLTVLESPDPEIQFEGSDANFTVCEDEAFDLTVVLTAGMAPYTYSWTLPNGSTGAGSPYSVAAAVEATHEGTWVVTVTDANGCTGTDNIQVTVDPAPANNSCGDAISLGSGTSNISASGDNTCGGTGGGCGVNSESAVYYTYTVPPDGITELVVIVDAPHVVSVSTACGGGGCSNEETIMCPDKGATYYITVSSSEANEGPFNLNVRPTVMVPDITGTLYIDLDASGTFGASDVGFMGATMDLLQGCPGGAVVASTTTGADGSYTFGNLAPGSYTVQVNSTAPGAPDGDPSPKECCLVVDPCMPNAVLMCDMGFPPPDCSSNPYSIDNICETAYDNPLCDLRVVGDFACGQNPSALGPWEGIAHCGGVYHNTSFYGFVAGSGSYNIEFTIFNCGGSGIQYGLMDACSPGGPYVVCDGSATPAGTTISVPSSNLEPCKTYVFWIDGFSASICSYYIHVTGDFNICEVPKIVDLLIDTQCDPLCPINGSVPVTAVGEAGIPAIENINGVTLHWDVTFPDKTTLNLVTNSQDDGLTLDIPFFQVGTYKICVASEHPCSGLNPPFCKEFVVENIPDTFKEFKVCTADFPWAGAVDPLTGDPELDEHGNQWAWFGGEITLAQIRTDPPSFDWGSPYTNECGCAYTQSLKIIEIGTATGKDSFALCKNELPFSYRDTTFATEFSNLLYKLEGVLSKNGCDSVVNISTRILDYGGTITNDCVQGGLEMTFEPSLQFITNNYDSINFAWKNAAGTLMVDNDSDSTNIVVPTAGAYSLVVSVFKYGKSCSFPFTHTIDLTGRLPLAPIADNWPLKICENDSIATYNVLAPDATLTYLWTVPATATKLSDDSTGTIIVRWNGPTGGDICVKARNLCGDSPNTCLPVVFVDMKDPAFNLAIEVCKDNTTPIIATSTHTPPVVYNWDFDGGSPLVPTGNGPGPHDVSWNATGVKTVSLSVSENGCLGKPVTKNIEVKELPAPPVISCVSSTVDGVIFEWNANVPGATSYNVNIISFGSGSGSAGPGPNQFQFTGMTTGDCAEIVVVAVIPGPCGNVTSLPVQCCASNCVLPSLAIAPIAPICLIPSTPVVNLTDAMVTVTPPTPGTGSFTVNGTATSVLNPNTLGAGTHTIGYTLEWDGGVCKQSTTSQVTINPTPSSDFTVSPGGCVLDPVTVTYIGGTTGATYTWDFGADVIGSYPGSGPHSVKWTNPGTKTITLSVTKNGCTSTVTTRTVTVNPVLTAPTVSCADQRIDGVTFGWLPVANASGYQIKVDIVGGANVYTGLVTTTSFDVPNITEGTQVVITVTAISNNGCPNTSASITCKATACPNAKITFPAKLITECLTPGLAPIPLPYTITNNLPGEVPTVTWSSSNPLSNSAINNATNPATFNPQVAKVGSHTLVLTYQQKDCIWKDSMLVELKAVPVASFTSLDKICISDPLVVTYTGTSTNGRVLNWTNGSAVRSDLTPTTFSFRWSTPGTYQIGLNVSLNGCTSEPFTKTVVVEDIPASPQISCAESLDKIIFSWTAVPCATEYEVLINGVTKGKQTTRTYTASGLVEGENVQIEIKAISTCECPILAVKETCTAKACPPVVITLTPSQTSICLVPNVAKITIAPDVKGNTPNGKGTWSGVGVDQSGIFDPAVAGLGVHEITYSYEDSNCQYEKKTTISVTQVPQIIWEAVQPKCYSDVSGSFIFQIAGGTAPYKLTMDGNAVSASPVNGVASGNHTFVVTDVNGCTSSQTFTITIPAQPSFEITGAAIVNINDPDATHTLDLAGMAAYLGKIDSIVWVQNGKTICSGSLATCSSVTNKPKLGPNEYSVTIYYNNGCKVTDVFLYVATDQFTWTFPNIINPNSKTGNSKFSIFTSDKSLFVKKMRVYDRWGNQVFIAENFSAYTDPVGWNGRFGGTDVVPGVYVYIFEMTSSSDDNIVETGDVTVIR